MPPPKTAIKRLVLIATKEGAASADRIAAARQGLAKAEASLKADGARPKRFLATFRLTEALSTKGTYDERRAHLVARIKALNGVRHHVSTSAWSLRTHHQTREDVLNALRPAIDDNIDFLEVVQTGDPVSAGVPKLKS